MTLVGIGKSSLRLLTEQGVDVGYLLRSFSSNVVGGTRIDDDELGIVEGVVTGTLRLGPEKIVEP
jgi:hypothetical protein